MSKSIYKSTNTKQRHECPNKILSLNIYLKKKYLEKIIKTKNYIIDHYIIN
jgi:hypothetical protein